MPFDLRPNGHGIDRAGDNHHQVVGHITRPIIRHQIIAGDGGKHFAMPDDGIAIGMLAKGGGKKRLAEPVVRIVPPHVDLAQNDIAFSDHLIRRQG